MRYLPLSATVFGFRVRVFLAGLATGLSTEARRDLVTGERREFA